MTSRLFRQAALDHLASLESGLNALNVKPVADEPLRLKFARTRARRVRTPTVLQMEAAECGAAALSIVLAYHRVYRPLEELREECGVSRDGTNARRILEVARKYGMKTSAYLKEPHELTENNIHLPAILHWNFDHFVALEGIDTERAWINDPERGRRVVSREEFDRSFTGPVLALEPGPDFRVQGTPPRILSALTHWLAGFRMAVAWIAVLGALLVLPGIAVPMLTRTYVDEVLARGQSDLLVPLFFGMGFAAVCRGLLTWLQRDALARLSRRLVAQLSTRYLWRAMRLPLAFYLARHPGDLAARVEIGSRLSWLLSGDLPATVLSGLLVLFYGAMMFALEPGLASLASVFALGALVVDRLSARQRTDLAHQSNQEQARLLGTSASGVQSIETLKANGAESWFFDQWSSQLDRAVRARHQLNVSNERSGAATRTIHSLATLGVLSAGVYRIHEGAMTVGSLVAFQSLLSSFFGPLHELAAFGARIDEIRAEVTRFQDVLAHPSTVIVNSTSATPLSKPERRRPERGAQGRIEFQEVTFGYDRSRTPIVHALTLNCLPGSRVAIVGQTGSGKSTVARLASGLLAPWSGEVRVIGRCATVEQETSLFEGTIAENVALWDPNIPRGAILSALKDACLEELLKRLPGGLDAAVSEGGRCLSGGERQRLELARALAREPSVLILDEATSALDVDTERHVYDRIKHRGCTCLIIAHRLSAIRDCDEIIVLDQGQVIERGDHVTLTRAKGRYHQLVLSEEYGVL